MKNLKSPLLTLILSLACFGPVSAMAQPADYKADFDGLMNSLKLSKTHFDNLEDYENPLVGPSKFILPESHAPWAANYFPMKTGGAASRWQTHTMPSKDEVFPTAEQLKHMTSKQIDLLSPAEKYDILVGDDNWSVTLHELNRRGPYRELTPEIWEGFCNGLRAAGLTVVEAGKAIDVTSARGITIRFQPADLKLLIGVTYFYVENYQDIGKPTRGDKVGEHQPNAAVFDLALRYNLAEKKKGFVIDTNLGPEVWNESVIGYSRKISRRQQLSRQESYAYPKAVAKLFVKTRIYSLGEISIEESNKPTQAKAAAGQLHKETPVAYWLYIDANGKTIDGRWRDQKDLRGVDFMWMSSGRGMDAQYSDTGTGNPDLIFKVVYSLVRRSAAAGKLSCSKIFSN